MYGHGKDVDNKLANFTRIQSRQKAEDTSDDRERSEKCNRNRPLESNPFRY